MQENTIKAYKVISSSLNKGSGTCTMDVTEDSATLVYYPGANEYGDIDSSWIDYVLDHNDITHVFCTIERIYEKQGSHKCHKVTLVFKDGNSKYNQYEWLTAKTTRGAVWHL